MTLARHVAPSVAILSSLVLVAALALPVAAKQYGAWGAPQKIDGIAGNSSEVNTPFLDGCPIISPDDLDLYLASNRPRFQGDTRTDIDIWVAHRSSTDAPFGDPVNLGEPINSAADDFCPTPVRGKGLFFVSTRVIPGVSCGGPDIYFARNNPAHGWGAPVNLGCGVNSAGPEFSPSFFEADGQAWLYFSSGPDIYASNQLTEGGFAPASPVAELNSAADDLRPNVGKGGLEIVFDSNRDGSVGGSPDLYFATRPSVSEAWSTPVNAGPLINTAAAETRGSFSWDGSTLYFGRAPGPEGSTDIYTVTR